MKNRDLMLMGSILVGMVITAYFADASESVTAGDLPERPTQTCFASAETP